MAYAAEKIDTGSAACPGLLKKKGVKGNYPDIWSIGDLDVLNRKLLGFFCSVRCPGDIILKTYDFARSFRNTDISLISGFHSPIEKDVFNLLLNGDQPIVICPARSIETMRIPNVWKKAIDNGQLLVLSPFEKKHKRITATLSNARNRFVVLLSHHVFFSHAEHGSRSEKLCKDILKTGKRAFTFANKENQALLALGADLFKIKSL